jgi:hypothetical protein
MTQVALEFSELRPDPNQILTIEEAAAEAGGLHPRSIRRAIKSGMLHALEFRTAPQARPMYRIRRRDLWRWLEGGSGAQTARN